MKRIKHLVWLAGVIGLTGVVMPNPADAEQPLGAEWVAVPAAMLEDMRGGFVAPSGLVLSFGIERVATVNGELVAASRVSIPDIRNMTVDEAQALASVSESRVLQVGGGTVIQTGGTGNLVIQNALDGQTLQAMTTLNVSVGTLGMFQDLNLGTAMHNAMIGSGSR